MDPWLRADNALSEDLIQFLVLISADSQPFLTLTSSSSVLHGQLHTGAHKQMHTHSI